MMYDYFLKFTDKAQADEVLAEYITVDEDNNKHYGNETVSIHIVGTIRNVTGYEADGETPIITILDGFHVNVRSRTELVFDAVYVQAPVTPSCVFG